ncbi:MAG: gamma-glutamylcyclotransferase [Elainellaceae cyanobacterium]
MTETRVFVYGTLQPGEQYYDTYCAGQVVAAQAAYVRGQLFDLALGYPAITEGKLLVYGVLLCFANPNILLALDELEDYDARRPAHLNEYLRVQIEAFSLNHESLGMVWVYQMLPERIQRLGGIPLPAGRWTGTAQSLKG